MPAHAPTAEVLIIHEEPPTNFFLGCPVLHKSRPGGNRDVFFLLGSTLVLGLAKVPWDVPMKDASQHTVPGIVDASSSKALQ